MAGAEIAIVTLNCWKGEAEYHRRLDAMAHGLAALAPDIVCLQESFASRAVGADTAGELAARLRLAATAAPARRKARRFGSDEVESTSGLAVLSRLPVLSATTTALPSDPRDGDRLAQVVTLAVGDRRLRILNLHLTHLPEPALRAQQLGTAVAALPEDGTATLLAGDLNAQPDEAPLPALVARGARAALPFDELPATHPVGHLAARTIDYLLSLSPNLAPLSLERVLDRPDPVSGVTPSDHAGLFGRFLLAG